MTRPFELDEAVLVGQRELVGGHERHRVLAERGQHLLHRGQRADGVAVRALVRGQAEALVRRGCARSTSSRDGQRAVGAAISARSSSVEQLA